MAEICGDESGLAALGCDPVNDCRTAVGVASLHDDFGAVAAKLLGRRLADARGGTGDQGAEALEVSLSVHVRCPFRWGSLRQPPRV